MNEPNGPRQEELRREIEHTRADLGATVEALSHKADVKTQVREKVDEGKEQVREKVDEGKQQVRARPLPAVGIALAAGIVLGWFVFGRR